MSKERKNCNIECIKPLHEILKKKNKEIAALIMEPMMMGAAGIIIYPEEYLKKAAELTKRYNVHLILDEVATGFGRTGKMFACEHAGVRPDFMCLSKGITSGNLAFAATLTTEKIYQAFYDDYENRKTFYHGHTYTANPIGASAALASLKIFKQERVLGKVKKLSKVLKRGIETFREVNIVGDIRHIGMIAALELVKNKETKEPFAFKDRIGAKVYQEGLKENLILRPLGTVIYFFLPLCIKSEEIEIILSRAFEVISKVGAD